MPGGMGMGSMGPVPGSMGGGPENSGQRGASPGNSAPGGVSTYNGASVQNGQSSLPTLPGRKLAGLP